MRNESICDETKKTEKKCWVQHKRMSPQKKKIDVEYYGKKYFVANLCPNQWRKEKVLRATQKNVPPEKRRNSVEHKKKQNNRINLPEKIMLLDCKGK